VRYFKPSVVVVLAVFFGMMVVGWQAYLIERWWSASQKVVVLEQKICSLELELLKSRSPLLRMPIRQKTVYTHPCKTLELLVPDLMPHIPHLVKR